MHVHGTCEQGQAKCTRTYRKRRFDWIQNIGLMADRCISPWSLLLNDGHGVHCCYVFCPSAQRLQHASQAVHPFQIGRCDVDFGIANGAQTSSACS